MKLSKGLNGKAKRSIKMHRQEKSGPKGVSKEEKSTQLESSLRPARDLNRLNAHD
jgi:hypothetical protein